MLSVTALRFTDFYDREGPHFFFNRFFLLSFFALRLKLALFQKGLNVAFSGGWFLDVVQQQRDI